MARMLLLESIGGRWEGVSEGVPSPFSDEAVWFK